MQENAQQQTAQYVTSEGLIRLSPTNAYFVQAQAFFKDNKAPLTFPAKKLKPFIGHLFKQSSISCLTLKEAISLAELMLAQIEYEHGPGSDAARLAKARFSIVRMKSSFTELPPGIQSTFIKTQLKNTSDSINNFHTLIDSISDQTTTLLSSNQHTPSDNLLPSSSKVTKPGKGNETHRPAPIPSANNNNNNKTINLSTDINDQFFEDIYRDLNQIKWGMSIGESGNSAADDARAKYGIKRKVKRKAALPEDTDTSENETTSKQETYTPKVKTYFGNAKILSLMRSAAKASDSGLIKTDLAASEVLNSDLVAATVSSIFNRIEQEDTLTQ